MPFEIRRLVFSDPELHSALGSFRDSLRTSPEPGVVVSCQKDSQEGLKVHAVVQLKSGRQSIETLDSVQVCAALISWCMANSIPMSRKAQKSVSLTKTGEVALDSKLSDKPQAKGAAPQAAITSAAAAS